MDAIYLAEINGVHLLQSSLFYNKKTGHAEYHRSWMPGGPHFEGGLIEDLEEIENCQDLERYCLDEKSLVNLGRVKTDLKEYTLKKLIEREHAA